MEQLGRSKDGLGDRMKGNYENRTRFFLPRRTFTILRVDGKAFHTYTRGMQKPCDPRLVVCMDETAKALVKDCQGAQFAYVQSDEISVLLTDFATIQTDAWFDGNLQKVVSVAASIATCTFNAVAFQTGLNPNALFDARAFAIPDPIEVENYFIWRQQDAVRNSIQGLAQSLFSRSQLEGLSCNELQEKLFQECGVNWNDLPAEQKRGRVVLRDGGCAAPPTFTQDRAYLQQLIPTRQD